MRLKDRQDKLQGRIKIEQGQLERLRARRLLMGLLTFSLFMLSQVFPGKHLELIALLATLPLFFIMVMWSRRQERFVQRLQETLAFYNRQFNFQAGQLREGLAPESLPDADLARDLDLHLLASQMDFCFTEEGQKQLFQWLCQQNLPASPEENQKALKEILKSPGLLRRLQAHSPERLVSLTRLDRELSRPFLEEGLQWRWVIPLVWLVAIGLALFGVTGIVMKLSFFLYAASVLLYLGKTQSLFSRLQDIHLDLESLSQRVAWLERLAQNLSFTPHLQRAEASQSTQSFSRLIALMSLRTNPILFYILNLLLPWEFTLAELSERARRRSAQQWLALTGEIASLDALMCLANLSIYQPTRWATHQAGGSLQAQGLNHPLLSAERRIANDFAPEHPVIVLTGSNMSGKSTFLRSLGINLILAKVGAPVFAEKLLFGDFTVRTCIRVSDSLRDGQSYFYAEVRRLKSIIEASQKERIFFLIDEPLRGTNNKERLLGNQHILNQLIKSGSRGLLSTHDLELTRLTEVEAASIGNAHFGEVWDQAELVFDYKLKAGPSTTTNALRILAREGLYPETKLS